MSNTQTKRELDALLDDAYEILAEAQELGDFDLVERLSLQIQELDQELQDLIRREDD